MTAIDIDSGMADAPRDDTSAHTIPPGSATAHAECMTPPCTVIDAHVHVWDPTVQRMPWLDTADPVLHRRTTLDELADLYRPLPDVTRRYQT